MADEFPELLTPGEVARLFRVDPKTVTRWAEEGRLTPVRTLGGHRRYRRSELARYVGVPDVPEPGASRGDAVASGPVGVAASGPSRVRAKDLDATRLAYDYLVGNKTIKECAREHGASPPTVRRVLLGAGVRLRPPGQRRTTDPTNGWRM